MKQLGKKVLISLVALTTFGAVSDKQANKNTTHAQTVDAVQLRTSANLLKAVNYVHPRKDQEAAKKELIRKANEAKARKEREIRLAQEKKAEKAREAKLAKEKAAALEKKRAQAEKAAEAKKAQAAKRARAKKAALTKRYGQTTRRNGTTLYQYVAPESNGNLEKSATYQAVQKAAGSTGSRLTRSAGVNQGPSGRETYYNLNMSRVVSNMKAAGYKGNYWVRSDGVKMFGNYVMVASNLSVRPRGTVFKTSLGLAIVCDTGSFAASNPTMTDIATTW